MNSYCPCCQGSPCGCTQGEGCCPCNRTGLGGAVPSATGDGPVDNTAAVGSHVSEGRRGE